MSRSSGITIHHDTYPFIDPTQYATILTGKTVLVTGASRGIGRAIALSFASAGANVAVIARTALALDTLVAEIKQSYPHTTSLAVQADVLTDATKAVTEVEFRLGPVDILVNSAGISLQARFVDDDAGLDDWWRVFEVNLKAPILMIKAITPFFVKRGRGTIVTLSSSASFYPLPFLSSYCGSKAGLQAALQVLDLELKPLGIKNFIVQPGAVDTGDSGNKVIKGDDDMQALAKKWDSYKVDTLELPGHSVVALAARSLMGEEGGVEWLSGRYWDCWEDLEEIIEVGRRLGMEKKGLYQLGMNTV